MKEKRKLNYEFSIRDIEQTKEKHYKRITKLKKDVHLIGDILSELESENEYWLYSCFDHSRWYWDRLKIFRETKTQKGLKELKNFVNQNTINHIQYLLKSYDIPESYFTAFYCIYYVKINNIMKRNIKSIINY